MTTFSIAPGLTVIDRKGWRADGRRPRLGRKVARGRRTHVIVHHTTMVDRSDTSPNIWETTNEITLAMRALQVVRADDLGADVPYNFVAFLVPDGLVICEGRGEDRTGAHTKGHNTTGIGIAFAGNFDTDGISGFDVARRLYLFSIFLGWLKFDASHADYGNFAPLKKLGTLRPAERRVYIHQDFKNTACPGKKLVAHLGQIDFIPPAALR